MSLNPPMLAGPHSEPFDIVISMTGLGPFVEELKSCLKIKVGHLTLSVLPLERIIASKLATDRPKDRLVVPVLENALRVARSKEPSA